MADISDNDPVYKDVIHFVEGSNKDAEYTYDPNGNLLCDSNKGIEGISYNFLNLPSSIRIKQASGDWWTPDYKVMKVANDYSFDGRKLRTRYLSYKQRGLLITTPKKLEDKIDFMIISSTRTTR